MLIRCWGARGSIPVSGEKYLRYGGETSCLEIRTASGETIIVDAGSGIRELGMRMLREGRKRCTMLFTHSHLDHIIGFPFFKLIYEPTAEMTLYECPVELGDMKDLLANLMAPAYYPVPLADILAKVHWKSCCRTDTPMEIHGVKVESIRLSHPNFGLGYKFTENGKTFVFLTDNELGLEHGLGTSFDAYRQFCQGADLLIHDAEYTDEEYLHTRGWGHSTWHQALQLALEADVKAFGLFHHNQDRSDDEIDEQVRLCCEEIARIGARTTCFAVGTGTERELV